MPAFVKGAFPKSEKKKMGRWYAPFQANREKTLNAKKRAFCMSRKEKAPREVKKKAGRMCELGQLSRGEATGV